MWVEDLDSPASPVSAESHEHPHQAVPDRPLWAALDERATHTPDADAVVEPLQGGWRRVSWELLQRQVDFLSRGLAGRGIVHGDRVALLVTPGADLIAAVYACWRMGATVVVVDAALGVRGIRRALRSAGPSHIIAIPKAIPVVQGLGARVIPAGHLARIAREGVQYPSPTPAKAHDEAIVVFT
jgi:acyl-CoA synthetase (AMP-forming)/AMP-acid ligase II